MAACITRRSNGPHAGIKKADEPSSRGPPGADLGAASPAPPFRQVITQKKTKFCLQTVKSNVLLSQNAGNAISETLDVQNVRGGGGLHA